MGIDTSHLDIATYEGDGYAPVVDYDNWRVAFLNYDETCTPNRIRSLERHNETDEVFVLLSGQCVLVIAGSEDSPGDLRICDMKPMRIYNVKKSTWHKCALTEGTRVLIVENRDTTTDNSDYADLSESQHAGLLRQLGGVYGTRPGTEETRTTLDG